MWWLFWAGVVVLFLLWAERRTRGRGSKDSGGANDHPTGKYI